ncbi:hypothetical protein [Candidatus Scalindua japonica]|nr:hypothetical protein [Candidatus Scalindua japonica]
MFRFMLNALTSSGLFFSEEPLINKKVRLDFSPGFNGVHKAKKPDL